MLKRLHNYPASSEVQRKTGHVYVKDVDGKWHPRGRVKMSRFLRRALLENEKVFHVNGRPDDDHPENLIAIKFTGTRYAIDHSRPVFIPSKLKERSDGSVPASVRRRPERVGKG